MKKTLKRSDHLLTQLSQACYRDERESVMELLQYLAASHYEAVTIIDKARAYISQIRQHKKAPPLERFFMQYDIDSKEGTALLTLAEALLRVPDNATIDALLEDKLVPTTWQHRCDKKEDQLQERLSVMGLQLLAKLMKSHRVAAKTVETIIRPAVRRMICKLGKHFVLAQTVPMAIERSQALWEEGYSFSYDLLGEGARGYQQAEEYFEACKHMIISIAAFCQGETVSWRRSTLSFKLSALHPKVRWTQRADLYQTLLPKLVTLVQLAKQHRVGLTIDAEEIQCLDITLDLLTQLLEQGQCQEYDNLGIAVQAYHKAALLQIDYLAQLAQKHQVRIPVRLVKGAYWDHEIKQAQQQGVGQYPVFTRKEQTDISYLACVYKLKEHSPYLYPQFASHNAFTIAAVEQIMGDKEYELQRLYGMGEGIFDALVKKRRCRLYAPIGVHKVLLPYLIRRLLENAANTSFVKMLYDEACSLGQLTQDPVQQVQSTRMSEAIRLPASIYLPTRLNAPGMALESRFQTEELMAKITPFLRKTWRAGSVIGGKLYTSDRQEVVAPYCITKKIGTVSQASEMLADKAMVQAAAYVSKWSQISVEKRVLIIENLAKCFEKHKAELIALDVCEAGKTIENAVAEVREAMDFCYYYAAQARRLLQEGTLLSSPVGEKNTLSLHPRGVFLCISPWNFPLAIFVGQIVAALVTGNTVVAKPAEAVALMAYRVVSLMHQSGVPKQALHLVIGKSSVIGQTLLQHPALNGVAFTGSYQTARHMAVALAQRQGSVIPMLAETGGINAMIVDSSALLEQTVDHILVSAFNASGQRCSALRLLLVQGEISDALMALLKDAVQTLKMGNPEDMSVQVGPVIHQAACEELEDYIKHMKAQYPCIGQVRHDPALREQGYFVPPHIFEVKAIEDLKQEVFGPVLHVVRFQLKDLDNMIDRINQMGYGLTLGIQSRLRSRAEHIRHRAKVGNIYVNRSMTGAVVGVQPFGGEGLSGTGPKAGGPNYLLRFLTERTYTIDTSAIGGSIELLNGPS